MAYKEPIILIGLWRLKKPQPVKLAMALPVKGGRNNDKNTPNSSGAWMTISSLAILFSQTINVLLQLIFPA
jgi:hypothetical protein